MFRTTLIGFAMLLFTIGQVKPAIDCTFSQSSYPYATYIKRCFTTCCSDDCCGLTYAGSSWTGGFKSTSVDHGSVSHKLKGWVIGVIVAASVVVIAIIVCIVCCIVQATKSATRGGTVIHPATYQPNVTVVSSGQQGSTWAPGGVPYTANYGLPVPQHYPHTPSAYPVAGPCVAEK